MKTLWYERPVWSLVDADEGFSGISKTCGHALAIVVA
jgi:hypothetical protein